MSTFLAAIMWIFILFLLFFWYVLIGNIWESIKKKRKAKLRERYLETQRLYDEEAE